MKILHLLNTDSFSGAENVVCQIIEMFRCNKNYEMIYSSFDGQIREILAEKGIVFVPIQSMSISEIKRLIREQKPDLIHAHDMKAGFFASLSCGNLPIISHIHNNAFDSRGLSLKSIAYIFAALKAKHIFWVTQSAYEGYYFYTFIKYKSSILNNIIDIDNLYKKMNSDSNCYEYDVVFVGRITTPKNPQRLILLFSKVVAKLPKIKIGVVGTGELFEEVKQLAARLKLTENVDFLGYKDNPIKILYDAKVMVMTSRWEGTPMCALEAMALGVPIVSTPTDGLRRLVNNKETGFLSENDDELAEGIIKIVTDNNLRLKMSKKSILMAKELNNIDRYRKELMHHYENSNSVYRA